MRPKAQIRDRFALVTGGSTGIGFAIAERLAAQGAHLVLVARSSASLDEAATRLVEQYGVTVHCIPVDLASYGAPRQLAEKLAADGIEIEMLVNSAGLSTQGPVVDSDPVRLRTLVDLNAGALTELTAVLLPPMVTRGHGVIINVASTGAYVPAPQLAVYAASKTYVLAFTQALWAETRGSGVRIVAVSPGPTQTPMNPDPGALGRQPAQVADTALRALGRSGPAVIDGSINAVSSHLFRLLPGRLSATLAGAIAARMQS
jgi:uncharacterized protein